VANYATVGDLEMTGLPPGALTSVSYETKVAALSRASAYADTALKARGYTMPLAEPYDPVLVDAVVQIAAYRLMVRRGFDPNAPGDAVLRMGYDDAIAFFRRVANGELSIAQAQAVPGAGEPQVITSTARGYLPGNYPVGPHGGGL
jgi:phage gp36-like protein